MDLSDGGRKVTARGDDPTVVKEGSGGGGLE
ncbi:hypothetical protein A2U01_0091531, partial [Trifolium medium]|nr:hypothetical protein [Trifolium medium]